MLDGSEEETSVVVTMALMDNSTLSAYNATGGSSEVLVGDCAVFKLILYGLAMGLLCAVGFVGNTLSILVLKKDRSTPVASFLLQSLAIADNIFLLLWLIHYSMKYILQYLQHRTVAWLYIRVSTFPIMYMAQTQTIWLTVVIALNRFMAVCMPYRAPHLCNINNVYKEVSLVTIFSIVYNVPRFFELQVDDKNIIANRTEIWNNPIYKTVYTDAFYYIFTFILPLLILAFVNTKVIIAYNASRQRRRRMTSSIRRSTDNENNITLVMIMIVVIFMLCQAPARIVQISTSYTFAHCHQIRFYLIHLSNTLEVLNSSVNFLIYCVFHKRFRDIMQQHFCCGPLASTGRRDSARFTTTEGLSLEEVQKTTSVSSKKGSSIKSSSQEHNRNGSLPYVCDKATVITMTDGELHEEPAEDQNDIQEAPQEKSTLVDKNNSKDSISDPCTEPRDDVLEPLAP